MSYLTAVEGSSFDVLHRKISPTEPTKAIAGWWDTFTASHWGFRCEGFCQHPEDFHTCWGAGRKNKVSLATAYGFVFPINHLLESRLHSLAATSCWEGKGNFKSPQILTQGQNPALANPHLCYGPSEQGEQEKSPEHSNTRSPLRCCQPGQPGMGCFLPHSPLGLAVISKHLLQIIQDYRN